jgi:speckle-type POZ protein
MASVLKIREGIFKISWAQRDPRESYGYYNQQSNVKVELSPGIAALCIVSRQAGSNGSREEVVELEIEIDFSPLRKPRNLDIIVIQVSKNQVNQTMKLENSKWKATFNYVREYISCGNAGFHFEIIVDLAADSSERKSTKHVVDHLLNLWSEKPLADVTFKFKRKIIKAHMMIVSSGSPVFCAMFQNDFKEKLERTVEIKDIQPNVFDHLLRYIYTGNADLDNVDVSALLAASEKYGMDSLKEECALRLSQDLNVENAVRNLVLAHLNNSPVLQQSTLDFISKNSKTICSRKDWMELIKNYPELSFAAVQKMVKG